VGIEFETSPSIDWLRHVGQAFARLLISKKKWLKENYGLEVEVLAISTRTRGSLMSKKAIDLHHILGMLERGEIFKDSMTEYVRLSPLEIIEACDANLMVELTTLTSIRPTRHRPYQEALGRGLHVVNGK